MKSLIKNIKKTLNKNIPRTIALIILPFLTITGIGYAVDMNGFGWAATSGSSVTSSWFSAVNNILKNINSSWNNLTVLGKITTWSPTISTDAPNTVATRQYVDDKALTPWAKWDKGDTWNAWPAWAAWAAWAQGIQWIKGDTWNTWLAGAAWAKWDKGDTWNTWPAWAAWAKWDKGDTWNTWPAGAAWATGAKWDTWNTWPAGSDATNYWSKNGTKLYYNTNNIGIWTNNPNQKLDVVWNINLSWNLLLPGYQRTTTWWVATYENVAQHYWGNINTGTFIIKIGNTPNMMIDADISVQWYSALQKFQVRWYTYTSQPAWYTPAASCIHSGSNGSCTVRFGKETSTWDRVILLGTTTTNWWGYPHVTVNRVSRGYPGSWAIWNWSIAIVTNESAYSSIVTPNINDKFVAHNPSFTGNASGNIPTANNHLATKAYVDNTVSAAGSSSGEYQIGTYLSVWWKFAFCRKREITHSSWNIHSKWKMSVWSINNMLPCETGKYCGSQACLTRNINQYYIVGTMSASYPYYAQSIDKKIYFKWNGWVSQLNYSNSTNVAYLSMNSSSNTWYYYKNNSWNYIHIGSNSYPAFQETWAANAVCLALWFNWGTIHAWWTTYTWNHWEINNSITVSKANRNSVRGTISCF